MEQVDAGRKIEAGCIIKTINFDPSFFGIVVSPDRIFPRDDVTNLGGKEIFFLAIGQEGKLYSIADSDCSVLAIATATSVRTLIGSRIISMNPLMRVSLGSLNDFLRNYANFLNKRACYASSLFFQYCA